MFSIGRILRESSKFTAVSVLSKLVSLPVTVILGRALSAEQFGAVAAVTLVLQYASLISPGFTNASAREIAHHSGADEAALAEDVESVANAADLCFSLVAFAVLLGVAAFQVTTFGRVAYGAVALIYLAERFKTYYFNANYYRQRFNVNVLANTVGAFANPVVAVLLVSSVHEYALLAAPLAASVAGTFCYALRSDQGLVFRWDPRQALRLFKVGSVLSLTGLAFWAYRLVDRTAITLFLSPAQLGYYFYAATYTLMALNVLADFGRVLESMLWSRLGASAQDAPLRNEVVKLSLFIACVGGAAIPVLQVGYEFLVTLFVPRFSGTSRLFDVMSLAILPSLVAMVPHVLLRSKVANKQHLLLWLYAGAALVGFGVDALAIKLGYGLVTIVWLSLACAALVAVVLVILTRTSVSGSPTELMRFAAELSLPAGAVLLAFLAFDGVRQLTGSALLAASVGPPIIGSLPLLRFMVKGR